MLMLKALACRCPYIYQQAVLCRGLSALELASLVGSLKLFRDADIHFSST